MKAAPVTATAFAFESVMVSVEVPAMPIGFAANAFAIVGCVRTVSVALPAAAVPAFVVVTLPVLLRYAPAVALVTFTVTVHEPLAGTVAPESARLVPLFAAVTVAPAQVLAPEADAVFTRFSG